MCAFGAHMATVLRRLRVYFELVHKSVLTMYTTGHKNLIITRYDKRNSSDTVLRMNFNLSLGDVLTFFDKRILDVRISQLLIMLRNSFLYVDRSLL